MIRYDTIAEFNKDGKAECDQLNLAHETKTNKHQCHLVQYRFKIREGSREGIRRLFIHLFSRNKLHVHSDS